MSLRIGEVINSRYRIQSLLGQGGFGAVYRVEDLSLKTLSALKENLDYWDEAQRQFEREALILAGLRHPNLPRVTDYFTIPAQGQYLVMDFVEGYDLQQVIDRTHKPLYEKPTLKWIDQICAALSYLHAQNPPIVHRDVKPANIRVTPDGVAMLVDFGVAKFYRPNVKTTLGARAVTAGYSPIEQYGEGTTDTRADIYSLGATLYTLLTAQRPPESIERVSGKALIEPRRLNQDITPTTERVIVRALEVLAQNRYATIDEMRQALTKAAQQSMSPVAKITNQLNPPSPAQAAPTSPQISSPISRPFPVAPPSHKTAVGMEWLTIPAGEFLFGHDKRPVYLPAFQISRFPITNQQYRHFLLSNLQVRPPATWKGADFPLSKTRHPVTGVTFHDAQAFCRWLGCRLPTAQEWEKAARGPDGRPYPWGNDWVDGKYCNNWDARCGGTTVVDKYPEGVSPYEVFDMIGNIWEWTNTEYQGPFMRELRGGSWRSFSRLVMQIWQQDGLMLDDSRDDVGFRCVLPLP